jgi:hypothetical protein
MFCFHFTLLGSEQAESTPSSAGKALVLNSNPRVDVPLGSKGHGAEQVVMKYLEDGSVASGPEHRCYCPKEKGKHFHCGYCNYTYHKASNVERHMNSKEHEHVRNAIRDGVDVDADASDMDVTVPVTTDTADHDTGYRCVRYNERGVIPHMGNYACQCQSKCCKPLGKVKQQTHYHSAYCAFKGSLKQNTEMCERN